MSTADDPEPAHRGDRVSDTFKHNHTCPQSTVGTQSTLCSCNVSESSPDGTFYPFVNAWPASLLVTDIQRLCRDRDATIARLADERDKAHSDLAYVRALLAQARLDAKTWQPALRSANKDAEDRTRERDEARAEIRQIRATAGEPTTFSDALDKCHEAFVDEATIDANFDALDSKFDVAWAEADRLLGPNSSQDQACRDAMNGQSLVELAAYCGHAASRLIFTSPRVGGLFVEQDDDPLADWVNGLFRWGQTTLVRAAVAAARVAWDEVLAEGKTHLCTCHTYPHTRECHSGPLVAIEAAERWLDDPSEENREAWDRASLVCSNSSSFFVPLAHTGNVAIYGRTREKEIRAAARIAGVPAVRAAICAALITWALGDK